MGELKGEPSLSNVKLSLDFGSLVVGTKKLKKESTFDIESSVGTAGIRGTEFQVASWLEEAFPWTLRNPLWRSFPKARQKPCR